MHRHAPTPSLSACCWLPSSRAFCRLTDLSGSLLTQGKVRKLSGMRKLYWHNSEGCRTFYIQTPRYCPVGIDRWSFWACQIQPFLLDIIICFVLYPRSQGKPMITIAPAISFESHSPWVFSVSFLSSFPSTCESRQYLGTSTSGTSIAGPPVYFIPADKSNSSTAPPPQSQTPSPTQSDPLALF